MEYSDLIGFVYLRPYTEVHRYTQMSAVHRHPGRDCQDPEHRDVVVRMKNKSYTAKKR